MPLTTNNGLTNLEIGRSLIIGESYKSVVFYNLRDAILDNTEP